MARRKNTRTSERSKRRSTAKEKPTQHQGWFAWAALEISRLTGRPSTFVAATMLIVLWAASGPLFGFSDTWQLVVNTSTTIITFLMVFLIQNTQNRDTTALQVKLDELIFRIHGAKNKIAAAEQLSDEELERLHAEYQRRAEHALTSLEHRRESQDKTKST
jgi:low affinity Fe/Cu permease